MVYDVSYLRLVPNFHPSFTFFLNQGAGFLIYFIIIIMIVILMGISYFPVL